jgi:hypothetical protein
MFLIILPIKLRPALLQRFMFVTAVDLPTPETLYIAGTAGNFGYILGKKRRK